MKENERHDVNHHQNRLQVLFTLPEIFLGLKPNQHPKALKFASTIIITET